MKYQKTMILYRSILTLRRCSAAY